MKFSSSLKVGILTLSAIIILLFTVLWIKGRAISSGERIEVQFRDVNGIRAGSAVQMMGLRIGQIEEVIPIINAENSFVKIKFVITEKGVKIPEASTISIQQSGIIGEQFLEIMPPKIMTVYLPNVMNSNILQPNDSVKMILSKNLEHVGKVLNIELIDKAYVPKEERVGIPTNKAFKVSYVITMPGLILPEKVKGQFSNQNLKISLYDKTELEKPNTNSPYTIIEPMRISDFLDLQYQAAQSLSDVNDKINTILSEDAIADLQDSIKSINNLTKRAATTMEKAEILIDSSKNDIEMLLKQSEKLVQKLTILTENVNELVSDKELKTTVLETAKSLNSLSKNVNTLMQDADTKEIIKNTNEISKNLAEISQFVNSTTKDPTFRKNINETLANVNKMLESVNKTLAKMENLDEKDKAKVSSTIADVVVTTRNLREFSEKLNKRFLLFRLMF